MMVLPTELSSKVVTLPEIGAATRYPCNAENIRIIIMKITDVCLKSTHPHNYALRYKLNI
jgi:hypothetical protein